MLELWDLWLVLQAITADYVLVVHVRLWQSLLLAGARRGSSTGLHGQLIVLQDELVDQKLVGQLGEVAESRPLLLILLLIVERGGVVREGPIIASGMQR